MAGAAGRRSMLELIFENRVERAGLPSPVVECYFALPERKWRFDFAWPDHKLAVEIEGGTWSGGRHVRGSGYANDLEKNNVAVLLGWRVLRFTGSMVEDGTAVAKLRVALGGGEAE